MQDDKNENLRGPGGKRPQLSPRRQKYILLDSTPASVPVFRRVSVLGLSIEEWATPTRPEADWFFVNLSVSDLPLANAGPDQGSAKRLTPKRRTYRRMTGWNGVVLKLPRPALLHKSVEGRPSPFPRRIYPTGTVTGMPSAV